MSRSKVSLNSSKIDPKKAGSNDPNIETVDCPMPTQEKNASKKESTVSDRWEPPHWQEFLGNLRCMRLKNDAPVDTMGCEMCIEGDAPPEVYRYQCLISLMLSMQTKDEITYAAMQRLIAKGLNVDNILKMSSEDLGKLIYPVGFWKSKVRFIKKTTNILKEQYNGDIPNTVEGLLNLHGVGPKIAHICMYIAWNKVTGIGVDTHVHRITNRIGWVRNATSQPEKTRRELESWLPKNLWGEVNHLMVGFGQTVCVATNPNCGECLNRHICPSSRINASLETKPVVQIRENEKVDDNAYYCPAEGEKKHRSLRSHRSSVSTYPGKEEAGPSHIKQIREKSPEY